MLALAGTCAAACSTVLSAGGDGTSNPDPPADADADGGSKDGATSDAASDVFTLGDAAAPGCTGLPLFCEDFDPQPVQTFPASMTAVGGIKDTDFEAQLVTELAPPSTPNSLRVTWQKDKPSGVMFVNTSPVVRPAGQSDVVARFRMRITVATNVAFFEIGKPSAAPSMRLLFENSSFKYQVGTSPAVIIENVPVAGEWMMWTVAVNDKGASSEFRIFVDGVQVASTTAEPGIAANVRFGIGASAVNSGDVASFAQIIAFDDVRAD